ncbi:hypothetical protein VNO78_10813 [Psophocarpus tetragonolobus]|uniref:Uncharacterized protein n=1 Tax=Psophocarpus tetragonolobus TaxID=3891 RepID=A0AAN9XMV6_PSOTE
MGPERWLAKTLKSRRLGIRSRRGRCGRSRRLKQVREAGKWSEKLLWLRSVKSHGFRSSRPITRQCRAFTESERRESMFGNWNDQVNGTCTCSFHPFY